MPRQLELITVALALLVAQSSFAADPPILITGHQVVPEAGLPIARGVDNIQVFRASRAVPELADQKGWTYHHHVDMACWKGRLYVAWNSCEKDEDVWPSRELYATSTDGVDWSQPAELFPPEISMASRMYFFHSPAGRMLAISAFRGSKDPVTERKKGAMIVREIRADHSLGDVF